jgi:beta-galactosidase
VIAFKAAPGKPEGSLTLITDAPVPSWTRTLFNGYGQVILGSTGEPGDVTLTASAKGLKPASVTLKAEARSVSP